jgi:hypothetical protein
VDCWTGPGAAMAARALIVATLTATA